ncbi:NAC domain-containing protein 35 [Selaginella moellendorffii]|uniref:NAC domain-containing protein 35 n=1 Tax=Selaginella moellendorffii TaxID=88036 RepID=UPI000D1C7E05|nr:NAC domain-containing protein 35 [Selaginella moellendorffii]|eukprot:XP_002960840.2 NAC domain-containing protein 35 [Selaginella moellendorffii]
MRLGRRVAVMEKLPGFRFSPTEYELVGYYLRKLAEEKELGVELIAVIDLVKHDPWELPGLAISLAHMGDTEWYFFVPRQHKYPNGSRPNRVTPSGYWKATGTDKPVMDKENNTSIGLRKTLVFYKGKAPKGEKTPWIMSEYRLPDEQNAQFKNEFTLCKIYRKSGSGAYNKNSPGCSLDVQKGESCSDSEMSPSELQVVAEDDQNDDKGTIRADEEADHKEQLDNIMFSGFEDIEHLPSADPAPGWGYSLPEAFQWNNSLDG